MKACYPRRPQVTVRLAARLLLECDGLMDIRIQNSPVKLSGDQQETVAAMIMVLREYMTPVVSLIHEWTASDLVQLFAHVLARRQSIMTCDCRDIGCAIFDKLSQVNHSCDPNSVIIFESSEPVASLKSLRNIGEREDVTVSYVSPLLPALERQAILQNEYNIKCDCIRCRSDAISDPLCAFKCRCKHGSFSLTDEQVERYRHRTAINMECSKCGNIAIGFNFTLEKYSVEKTNIEQLFGKLDGNSSDAYVALVRKIDNLENMLVSTHTYLMKCWSRLVVIFDSLNMLPEAIKYSAKLLQAMVSVLPELHPELLNRQFYHCQLIAASEPDIKTSIEAYHKCISNASKIYSEKTNRYFRLQLDRFEELKHICQHAIEFRAR